MIDSTDRERYQPRMPIPMPRPQFDIGMERFNQPTQVAPQMEPPAAPQMRSVLKDRQGAEENIRRMIEQMKGYQRPGFQPPIEPPMDMPLR